MVNTVSNTSSLLGLLSNDQQGNKTGSEPKSNRNSQEVTDLDTSCHMTQVNNKTQTEVVIEKQCMHCGDVIAPFSNQTNVIDENGDVIDSGVFERTYFDETLENDDDDYDRNADIEDFYGSKLSFLSSNDEEDHAIMT